MNAINLFKIWFETAHPTGEIIEINGKNVFRTHKSTTYYDIETDKTFMRIQSCISNRNKSKKALFSCSCGICNAYLMTELYNNTIKNNSENMIDEVLNEMFSNTADTKPIYNTSVNCDTTKSNPLNNMILTFGKYKDKTYKDVFSSDKEYCIWCIESLAIERGKASRLNDNMVAFVGYIKQRIQSSK
jgi:hypothetical protein